MKRILIIALLSLFITATVSAETVTISTGPKSGNYFKVGNRLKGMIGQGNVVISKGSVENLKRLLSGEAQVAMVQMDAYAWFLQKNPEAATDFEIMGELYKECAYLAVQCDGKVQTEDDLQKVKDVTVAIGKKGSGTAVTWDYMLQLEPKYKNSAVAFSGGTRSLGKLAAKQIDAVMWVTAPKLDGKMASTVMKNKDLCLVGFNDKDLNDKLPATGKPVYEFQKIDTVKGFWNDKEITTACVYAMIIARADTDEDVLEAISDALLNYKSSLVK